MLGFLCLGLGVVCALVSRVLLVSAAFSISRWWALGVLLPFGPLLFRLSYPEEVTRSRIFGLISVPCFFGFMTLGPGFSGLSLHKNPFVRDKLATAYPNGYGLEQPASPTVAPPTPAPTLEQRRAANEAEFARLRAWSERLLQTKRDLLHSDTEGIRRFNADATEFNAALEAANAEKAALESAH